MALPRWEEFAAPLLQVMADGELRFLRDIRDLTAKSVGLTEEQLAEVVPSGQSVADNRISWAASYLLRVGALERPKRGYYEITDTGRRLLAEHPDGIAELDLRAIAREGDEWWLKKSSTSTATQTTTVDTMVSPEEQVEQGIESLHTAVAADLLSRLLGKDPTFFENAVVKLLVAMGYGGAEGRAVVTAQTNDAGIDGIIDQDALGLSRVYVQAKRYAPGNSVGRPDLQSFVGALSGKADGGVFITTSTFSSSANEYARVIPARIILIDGQRLTSLMIRYGVGVQIRSTHHVVEVDEDFFE